MENIREAEVIIIILTNSWTLVLLLGIIQLLLDCHSHQLLKQSKGAEESLKPKAVILAS